MSIKGYIICLKCGHLVEVWVEKGEYGAPDTLAWEPCEECGNDDFDEGFTDKAHGLHPQLVWFPIDEEPEDFDERQALRRLNHGLLEYMSQYGYWRRAIYNVKKKE